MNGGRLLVIEDDARVSRFICNVAKRLGITCLATGTKCNIENAYQRSDPDVIFLDPKRSETQCKDIIRKLAEQHTNAAIVLAGDDPEQIDDLKNVGDLLGLNMAGVLPDIIDAATLKQEFHTLLNKCERVKDETDTVLEAGRTDPAGSANDEDLH